MRLYGIKQVVDGGFGDFSATLYDTNAPTAIQEAMEALQVGELQVYGSYSINSEGWAVISSAKAYDSQGNLVCDLVDFGRFDAMTIDELTAEVA